MDFTIPEEMQLLKRMIRKFVDEEIIPLEKVVPIETVDLPDEYLLPLQQKVKDMGLWALGVPQEYGGGGLNCLELCWAEEEMGRCLWVGTGTARPIFGGEPPVLLYDATEEQKQRYLYPCIRGERHGTFAQTEPSGGSDPAGAIQTKAVRDGDNWIINGEKIFVGHIHDDFAMVFARTNPERGRLGITCFIVDRGTPGFSVVREVPVMRPLYPMQLSFVDCVVPDSQRLGEDGQGFLLGQKFLVKGRITYCTRPIAIAERSLKMAIDWAKQRVTFGRPLAERQAIQWMLADSDIDIYSTRYMLYNTAWKYDQGEDVRHEAAAAKVYSTEMVGRVVDRAVQIFGGLGVSKDLPLERWYREVRIMRIGEGPSEIMRFIISRDLLRG